MPVESTIALACPYCNESIYATISWFKKTYSTCPACEQGLSAGQFATVISDLEQSMDANIEEMINGAPPGGCCGDKAAGTGGCCGSGGDKENKSACGCSH